MILSTSEQCILSNMLQIGTGLDIRFLQLLDNIY